MVEYPLIDYMQTSYEVRNLTVGKPYMFKIRPKNVCSRGVFSDVATIHTCNYHQQWQFKVSAVEATQLEAQGLCQAWGGNLANWKHPYEESQFYSNFDPSNKQHYWIGLHSITNAAGNEWQVDRAECNSFNMQNRGNATDLAEILNKENSHQTCVEMYKTDKLRKFWIPCNYRRQFIC